MFQRGAVRAAVIVVISRFKSHTRLGISLAERLQASQELYCIVSADCSGKAGASAATNCEDKLSVNAITWKGDKNQIQKRILEMNTRQGPGITEYLYKWRLLCRNYCQRPRSTSTSLNLKTKYHFIFAK